MILLGGGYGLKAPASQSQIFRRATDSLRHAPALKLACGRLPDSGADLCSQPTISRLENTPRLRDVIRLGCVLVDLWCASYAKPPGAVTLDIDDTVDVVHGHQQLSLFNLHYDERCFLPIHIYDTETSRPVAMILHPGKTPTGVEIRGHLRRLIRRVRRHWPTTRLTIRGDGHYGRPEVMDWLEDNGINYIFGLTGSKPLKAKVETAADTVRTTAHWRTRTPCAALPRPFTKRGRGKDSAASSPASRPPGSAWISALSSPAWISARRNGCMGASIAHADRPKT